MSDVDLYDDLATPISRLTSARKVLSSWAVGPTDGDTHDTPNDQLLPDEVAADRAAAARAARLHAEHVRLVAEWRAISRRLIHLDQITHPYGPNVRRLDTPGDYAADGYCRSCARVRETTPIATRPDGTPYYRDLCRWCGGWASAHDGQHPPEVILRAHHRGDRITPSLEARLLRRG